MVGLVAPGPGLGDVARRWRRITPASIRSMQFSEGDQHPPMLQAQFTVANCGTPWWTNSSEVNSLHETVRGCFRQPSGKRRHWEKFLARACAAIVNRGPPHLLGLPRAVRRQAATG